MEKSDSLPEEEREGKPKFGKIMRTKNYRWIFYAGLICFGIILIAGLVLSILQAADKFPPDDWDYDQYSKFMGTFIGLQNFLNAAGLLLIGFGCFWVGIVDYTLPPNVRRGFIFGITVFVLAYEFFTFFGTII